MLPISWAYIAMMGAEGLRTATQTAVLSANYIARRLAPYFPVVYAGRNGLVAHECIVDLRQLPGGITVDDAAKRLIDYGFHAPTMSFPVAGTFMIEPTESESLASIDEFCDAMIAIKAEMDKVASGEWDAADNPLKNAPHTAEMLMAQEWAHPYARTEGGYPGAGPGRPARGEVLAAGPPHRPGLRRPQPGLRLPAAGGLRLAHSSAQSRARTIGPRPPLLHQRGPRPVSRLIRREGGEKPLGSPRRRRSRR